MAHAYLWIEGVDFSVTMFDTSDLSTFRGSSLALLRAGEDIAAFFKDEAARFGIAAEKVFIGASQSCFKLSGASPAIEKAAAAALLILHQGENPKDLERDAKEAIKKGGSPRSAPYAHLRFVDGLAFVSPERDDRHAMEAARAQARAMQMRSLNVLRLGTAHAADQPCPIDGKRPASAAIRVPADRHAGFSFVEQDEDQKIDGPSRIERVSASVAARRHFGRAQRQAFYRDELPPSQADAWELTGWRGRNAFADSFHDLTNDPPGDAPLSIVSKIAVFYADGNKFTAIRDALGGGPEAFQKFSSALRDLQRKRLLPALLEPLIKLRKTSLWPVAAVEREKSGDLSLRFETLLWGGDEVRFVTSSWRGLALARDFFKCVADPAWTIDGRRLTFSAGLVIANVKTPIRSLVTLSEDLTKLAKAAYSDDAHRHKLTINVLESLEPPAEGPQTARRALLGLEEKDDPFFVLNGASFGETLAKLAWLKRALPRSQIYDWLRICRRHEAFRFGADDGAVGAVRRAIEDYARRTGQNADQMMAALSFEVEPFSKERPLGQSLFLLADLWDFVEPCAETEAES